MSTPTDDTLAAILHLNRRIERLERHIRDAIDSLESNAPAHALMVLKMGLEQRKGARTTR